MVRVRSSAGRFLAFLALIAPLAAHAETSAVEALIDPWRLEEGAVVARSVEVAREQVEAVWSETPAAARAAALRRARLELGLGDLFAPATVIAAATEDDPEDSTGLARDLAPGVPAFQAAHAAALWRSGDTGAAVLATGETLWSITTNLPAQLWLLENLAFLLVVVLIAASLAFLLLAALQAFSHAAHDIGDLLSSRMPVFARHAMLAALLLAPLVLGEGLIGLALGFFALAFAYGGTRQRNVLVMAATLFVIGLHPLAQLSRSASSLLEDAPVAGSVLQVIAGTESTADVERLDAAAVEDLAAAHALAYRDRRLGLVESSQVRLLGVIDRFPSDAVALANLGNIEKRRGNNVAAIDYYERAAAQVGDATLLFDLSQAYAEAFRMEEYEATLARAQRVDDRGVAALSGLGDAGFVADLGYPMELIGDRLFTLLLSQTQPSPLVATLAPGQLGEAWYVTGGAFALVALLCLLFADRWDHSSVCVRCGHRICTRCEETVWSEEICDGCHHLFHCPEATDPSLRMARLQALSEREARFDRIWLGLSVLVPGAAGFAARRPDLAMSGLLLFCWVTAWIAWPTGVFADPMLMGSVAFMGFAGFGMLAAAGYAGVVFLSLVVRKNR